MRSLIVVCISIFFISTALSQQMFMHEMVDVYGGTYISGATPEQLPVYSPGNGNRPAIAEVWDFKIGKYEVTNKLYHWVMGDIPSSNLTDSLAAVNNLTYHAAVVFCNEFTLKMGLDPSERVYYKDSLLTQPFTLADYAGMGRSIYFGSNINTYQDHNNSGYRMPTDGEWEYAARGWHLFPVQTRFAGSDTLELVGHFMADPITTMHVGLLRPNALGLYDMTGNAHEYISYYYSDSDGYPRCNPTRYTKIWPIDTLRVTTRGGMLNIINASYAPNLNRLPIAFRNGYGQSSQLINTIYKEPLGLRLAQSVGDDRTCPMDAVLGLPICNDNGTPSDSTDDTFTFTVDIDKHPDMLGWIATDPLHTRGTYYEPFTMGPYPISDGGFTFSISDSISSGFLAGPFMITPPPACSNACTITAAASNISCNDNGTATNPNDDTFTANIAVTGTNLGATWTSNNAALPSGSYGTA